MSGQTSHVGVSAGMSTIPSTSTDYSFASSTNTLASATTSATSIDDYDELRPKGYTVILDNLEPGTEALDVMSICGDFGEPLSCDMVKSEKSNGLMARVLMSTREQAESIVAALNGETADDRVLDVYLDVNLESSDPKIAQDQPEVTPAYNPDSQDSSLLSSTQNAKQMAAAPATESDIPAAESLLPIQQRKEETVPSPTLSPAAPTFAPSGKSVASTGWKEFKPSGKVNGWLETQQVGRDSISTSSVRSDFDTAASISVDGEEQILSEQGKEASEPVKKDLESTLNDSLASSTASSTAFYGGKSESRASSPVPSIKSPAVAAQERPKPASPVSKPGRGVPDGFVSAEDKKKNGRAWSTSSAKSPSAPTPALRPPSMDAASAAQAFWQSQALVQPGTQYGFYAYPYLAQPFVQPLYPALAHPTPGQQHAPNPAAAPFTPSRQASPVSTTMKHTAAPFIPVAFSKQALPGELGAMRELFEQEGVQSMTEMREIMPDEKTVKDYIDGLRKEYPKILTSYSAAFKLKNQLCKILGYVD